MSFGAEAKFFMGVKNKTEYSINCFYSDFKNVDKDIL